MGTVWQKQMQGLSLDIQVGLHAHRYIHSALKLSATEAERVRCVYITGGDTYSLWFLSGMIKGCHNQPGCLCIAAGNRASREFLQPRNCCWCWIWITRCLTPRDLKR